MCTPGVAVFWKRLCRGWSDVLNIAAGAVTNFSNVRPIIFPVFIILVTSPQPIPCSFSDLKDITKIAPNSELHYSKVP